MDSNRTSGDLSYNDMVLCRTKHSPWVTRSKPPFLQRKQQRLKGEGDFLEYLYDVWAGWREAVEENVPRSRVSRLECLGIGNHHEEGRLAMSILNLVVAGYLGTSSDGWLGTEVVWSKQ